jgi:hypothetical protein
VFVNAAPRTYEEGYRKRNDTAVAALKASSAVARTVTIAWTNRTVTDDLGFFLAVVRNWRKRLGL